MVSPERAWDAVRFSVPAPVDSTRKDQDKRSAA